MWNDIKKTLPKGNENRFLCSRENDVIICIFDNETKSFNIPGITAWRPLPKTYKGSIKRFLKKGRTNEN